MQSSSTHWVLRRQHIGGLTNLVRLLLGLLTLVGSSVGTFAILKSPAAEAGGSAILLGSVVILLFALAGRLPEKLSGGGVSIEFQPDSVRQILALIQSESPDLAKDVEDIIRSGIRPGQASESVLDSADDDRAADASFESDVRSALKAKIFQADVGEDVPVLGASVGRPPIVDMKGQIGGNEVVVEIKSTWTSSVSEITRRRIKRILDAGVATQAIVVVRSHLLESARRDFAGQSSVAVVSRDEIAEIPRILKAAEANRK